MAGISPISSGLSPALRLPESGGNTEYLDDVASEADEGDVVVVDLSNKKLERELVFTSVQSQNQQQSTVNEDGGEKSDTQTSNVNNESETDDGAAVEEDGPPPTMPDLSALDNPFFQRPSRSGSTGSRGIPTGARSPFSSSETGSVFQGSNGLNGVPLPPTPPSISSLGLFDDSTAFGNFGTGISGSSPSNAFRANPAEQVGALRLFAADELANATSLADKLSGAFQHSAGLLDIFA